MIEDPPKHIPEGFSFYLFRLKIALLGHFLIPSQLHQLLCSLALLYFHVAVVHHQVSTNGICSILQTQYFTFTDSGEHLPHRMSDPIIG